MFYTASQFTQTLCGQAWLDSTASNKPSQISDTLCSCPRGNFFDTAGPACHPCPAGRYEDANIVKTATCKACSPGTFSPPGASDCATSCPEGFSKSSSGTAACVFAPADRVAFVRPEELSSRGCDASNVYDEELPDHQQEFSDDEDAQAAKALAKKRGRDGGGAPPVYEGPPPPP